MKKYDVRVSIALTPEQNRTFFDHDLPYPMIITAK